MSITSIKKKIGVLTYHHIANNGAALFAASLCDSLSDHLPEYEVHLVNYQPSQMRRYELLKMLKLYRKVPFFNAQRYAKLKRFRSMKLCLEPNSRLLMDERAMLSQLSEEEYFAVIVAMDVWNIANINSLPKFPNIYWLPAPIQTKKIAYAVSGYRSDAALAQREKGRIRSLLNSFDLIGVRDEFTQDIVISSGLNKSVRVENIPDPTFLYEIKDTGVGELLNKKGIKLDKPILGILVFGKDEFSGQVRAHFKAKGFQIVALSMYNAFADVNLGHILSPEEWADIFKYFTFCITDRFHGAIFCLKSGIPFIAIEPDPLPSLRQSKIYSLLKNFDILDCYADTREPGFTHDQFFQRAKELTRDWEKEYRPGNARKLEEMKSRNLNFIQKIKSVLDN